MHRYLRVLIWVILIGLPLAVPPVVKAEPSSITLAVRKVADGKIQVIATVVDEEGAPAVEAQVSFKARTAFGWLPLAEVSTDEAGKAQIELPRNFRPGEVVAETGEVVHASVMLGQKQTLEPAVRPGYNVLSRLSPQPGFISPYPVPLEVVFLLVVLGPIWAIYGYVAWLLVRIRSYS